MFEALSARMAAAIDVVKEALITNDRIRTIMLGADFAASATAELPNQAVRDLISAVTAAPQKLDWQVYDYCASLTRLYAILDSFLDEIVGDYLSLLPILFEDYRELPDSLLRQHRRGVAEILSRLGTNGPFSHLSEADIISQFFQALSGAKSYRILEEAFFVDPHNYRLPILVRLLSSLGIVGARNLLIKHPKMVAFRNQGRDEDYTLEAELADFVARRNEAAHSEVNSTVSSELIFKFADQIKTLCDVIADILDEEVARLSVSRSKSLIIGSIYKVYKNRTVALVNISTTVRLAEGDEILVVRSRLVLRAAILEIQLDNVRQQVLNCSPGQNVGILVNVQCSEGDQIHLPIWSVQPPLQPSLPLSTIAAEEGEVEGEELDVADNEEALISESYVEGEPSGENGQQPPAEGTTT